MTVLILSSPSDAHAQAVVEQLQILGVKYKLWHFSAFMRLNSFAFSPGDFSNGGYLRPHEGEAIEFAALTSVWFRRPGAPKSLAMPEPWIERMVESECRSAIGGMFRSLDCLMVNHPARDSEAMFKLHQLREASKVGFIIPETLVTNEPGLASSFIQKYDGNVIYKLIGESTNFCFPTYEIPAGIPTLPVRSVDLHHLEQVRLAPHLFQARVDKVADIRVTAVGRKLFAVRIDSQAGRSKLDWRMDYSVPMEMIELPNAITNACLNMMAQMGLNYAAFDFCLDRAGQYVFLELNCGGQYLWMEATVNFAISHELALLLSQQTSPIVGPTPDHENMD